MGAPRMPLSNAASPVAHSSKGRCQAERPLSDKAVGTHCDPVNNVRVFRLVLDLVLRTVRADPSDPGFAMVETASLTAEAAWITLRGVPGTSGANRAPGLASKVVPT